MRQSTAERPRLRAGLEATRPLSKQKQKQKQKQATATPSIGKSRTEVRRDTRSRTFTGCKTCRARHSKCDETKPICGPCLKLNLPCGGYEARLLWVGAGRSTPSSSADDKGESHRSSAYRYQLFTERVRSAMTVDIVESLGHQTAGDAILDLDKETENTRQLGPFGVFRAFQTSSPSPSPPRPPSPSPSLDSPESPDGLSQDDCSGSWDPLTNDYHVDDQEEELITPARSAWMDVPDMSQSVSSASLRDPPWMPTEEGLDLSHIMSSDFFPLDTLFTTSPPRTPRFDGIGPGLDLYSGIAQCIAQETPDMGQPTVETYSPARILPTPPSIVSHAIDSRLPAHAETLLRYYREHALGGADSTHSKHITPWQVILLPCALETYAELSIWNTASYTRLSIMCTLLAKSAFHLHRALREQDPINSYYWRDVGETHQRNAQEHLKAAIWTEFSETGKPNYNESLGAVLALSTVSVLYNRAHSVKVLLLDAERLIRLRGLSLPKSFELRLLHHMYTHLRILSESIDITSKPSSPCLSTMPSLPLSSALRSPTLTSPSSFPSTIAENSSALPSVSKPLQETERASVSMSLRKFRVEEDRLGHHQDLSLKKRADIAYADIHLDISGRWPETLYPVMYGIPESLMTLLSQTVSLANEKPRLEALAQRDLSVSVALAQHVKTLEQNIWSWSLQKDISENVEGVRPTRPPALASKSDCNDGHNSGSSGAAVLEQPAVRSLVLAMHQAVIIYFYRRVYHMSAMVNQHAVEKVFDYLQPCLDSPMIDDQDFATSIGWASFVAACEAITSELQERSIKFLEAIDDWSVFLSEAKPSEIARSVWESRQRTGDWTCSWTNVSHKRVL